MRRALPFVAFGIGAAAGAAASWYFAKKKYEQIAQEEIDSVKEVFFKKHSNIADDAKNDSSENEENKAAADKAMSDIIEYASKLNDLGYTNYSDMKASTPEAETENVTHTEQPYIISPDEFDEMEDYEAISLTYYADGVLADDMDELVEDVDDVVGGDFASHFGEYGDDSVFVRNDRLKADYEILRDERNYSDVRKSKPYL